MNNSSGTTRLLRGKALYDSDKQAFSGADTLIIEGETIREIGTYEALTKKYPELPVENLQDCYLLPGLCNTHVHLEFNSSAAPLDTYLKENDRLRFVRAVDNERIMLRSGVTTVRDAGSSWAMLDLLNIRDAGELPIPRLQLAGPPLTITGGHLYFMESEADTADELVKSVRLHHKRRCGAIKLIVNGGQMTPGSGPERTSYTAEQIHASTQEAHHLGLPTFAHCLTTQGLLNAVAGGIQCIEHAACFIRNKGNGLLQRLWEPDVMEQIEGNGLYFMKGASCHYHMLDGYREGTIPCTSREEFLLKQEENMFQIFKNMCELGFTPVLGTDAGVAYTYRDETWLEMAVLVERAGLTPAQAIGMATVNSAACLGMGDLTGQLAAGFAADVVALRENPLENIRAFAHVAYVISGGRDVPGSGEREAQCAK